MANKTRLGYVIVMYRDLIVSLGQIQLRNEAGLTHSLQHLLYPWHVEGCLSCYVVESSVVNTQSGGPIRLLHSHHGGCPRAGRGTDISLFKQPVQFFVYVAFQGNWRVVHLLEQWLVVTCVYVKCDLVGATRLFGEYVTVVSVVSVRLTWFWFVLLPRPIYHVCHCVDCLVPTRMSLLLSHSHKVAGRTFSRVEHV